MPSIRRTAVVVAGVVALVAAGVFTGDRPSAATLPVQHGVLRIRGYIGRYNVATMKPVSSVMYDEWWIDGHQTRRDVTRRDGVVVRDEICAAPDCTFGSSGSGTSGSEARKAIQRDVRNGKAHSLGKGIVRGMHVRWFRYGTKRSGELLALDATTYGVVHEEDRAAGRLEQTWDLLVNERLPRRATDFTPVTLYPQLGSQQRPAGTQITAAAGAAAVPGAVWPGAAVGGVPVGSIMSRPWSATTTTGAPLSGTILDIRYGPKLGWLDDPSPATNEPAVEVLEAGAGDPARWFTVSPPIIEQVPYPPPPGFTDTIDTSFGYLSATLQEPGIWLVVRATSFALLRTTLHSLQPLG